MPIICKLALALDSSASILSIFPAILRSLPKTVKEQPTSPPPSNQNMASSSLSPPRIVLYLTALWVAVLVFGHTPKPLQATSIYSLSTLWIARSACAIAARRVGALNPACCTPFGIVAGTAVGTSHVSTTYDEQTWDRVGHWADGLRMGVLEKSR